GRQCHAHRRGVVLGRYFRDLLAIGGEHDQPTLIREAGDDSSLSIDRQVRLVAHALALPAIRDRDLRQRLAIRTEFLDAPVPRIGDPDVALTIKRNADLFLELAGRVAVATEHALER